MIHWNFSGFSSISFWVQIYVSCDIFFSRIELGYNDAKSNTVIGSSKYNPVSGSRTTAPSNPSFGLINSSHISSFLYSFSFLISLSNLILLSMINFLIFKLTFNLKSK